MKKGLLAVGFVALAIALAVPGLAHARQAEVTYAPLGRAYNSPPPLGRKQGWLTISNRDWQTYTLVVDRKDKLFLYRGGQGYGGMVIPSGATVTIVVEKETYDLYGNNSDKLKVRVREGRTTTLSLEPFGYVGNTGLMGVVNDGDKVRNEVLFDNYAPPVVVQQPPIIVQQPPTVIVNRPPPPPPVIVSRPPVVVRPGPPRRPPPPPPPPPRRHDRRDGWGFSFGFDSR